MPLFRRLPKRGFNPLKKNRIAVINLSKIQNFIEAKKINSNSKIDLEVLKKSKLLNKNFNKIKILGSGDLKEKIDIKVDFISKSAEEKLKKIGATVTLNKKN